MIAPMKIALLDNDAAQCALQSQALATDGHVCQAAASAAELLALLVNDSVDLAILDWHHADAVAVLAWVRSHLPDGFPVLILCQPGAAEAIDAGLAAGADDYQIKPLRRAELRARVASLLRRCYPEQQEEAWHSFGPFQFAPRQGRLLRKGEALELTRKEFDLALLLFRNLGQPLSRATIAEAVWARETDLPTRTMDTHVSRVRSKLGLRPEQGYRLTPVYSYGYLLEQV